MCSQQSESSYPSIASCATRRSVLSHGSVTVTPPREGWERAGKPKNSTPASRQGEPNNFYVEELLIVWNVTPNYTSERNIEIYLHVSKNKNRSKVQQRRLLGHCNVTANEAHACVPLSSTVRSRGGMFLCDHIIPEGS